MRTMWISVGALKHVARLHAPLFRTHTHTHIYRCILVYIVSLWPLCVCIFIYWSSQANVSHFEYLLCLPSASFSISVACNALWGTIYVAHFIHSIDAKSFPFDWKVQFRGRPARWILKYLYSAWDSFRIRWEEVVAMELDLINGSPSD